MTATQPAAQQIAPVPSDHDRRTAKPVIAFLGTGRMGGNLARAGFGVRAWDRAGELTVLASGPPWMAGTVAPVFAALGRATAWLGPAGNGTRAKLVLNNWLADLTETTAETLSFARQLDLDPAVIVDLLALPSAPNLWHNRAPYRRLGRAGCP
jgi:3-hydroxyisobutyrate dehydrogenase-like beta-hydroxyacid dehydrogenase